MVRSISRRSIWPRFYKTLLLSGDFAENAEGVQSEDLLQVLVGVAFLLERGFERRQLRDVLETLRRSRDPVEIAPDADVVDAGDLHGVIDVFDGVVDGGEHGHGRLL